MQSIEEIIRGAKGAGASDVHVSFGQYMKMRVEGTLVNCSDQPLTDEDCDGLAEQIVPNFREKMGKCSELDLAKTYDGTRTRINIFLQQDHVSIALRLLRSEIPDLKTLGLPPVVESFATLQKGLVLVTGETGSGKSTTLAAIMDRINQTRAEHIITLEAPIEYVLTPAKALVNQREIGKDTESYAEGIRASLREDPDVILIGEMRDPVSIETALTAAETGHVVFSTLHSKSASETITRVVSVFPPEQQQNIRTQLASCLQAVISQQLLPSTDGKRVLAYELMVVTPAIRSCIREDKVQLIDSFIQNSKMEGSETLDSVLISLQRQGRLSKQQCIQYAHDPQAVKMAILAR